MPDAVPTDISERTSRDIEFDKEREQARTEIMQELRTALGNQADELLPAGRQIWHLRRFSSPSETSSEKWQNEIPAGTNGETLLGKLYQVDFADGENVYVARVKASDNPYVRTTLLGDSPSVEPKTYVLRLTKDNFTAILPDGTRQEYPAETAPRCLDLVNQAMGRGKVIDSIPSPEKISAGHSGTSIGTLIGGLSSQHPW